MAKKDCPYCEGKNGDTFLLGGTNLRVSCEYCVKGVIPKLTIESEPGLLSRIANFFNGAK